MINVSDTVSQVHTHGGRRRIPAKIIYKWDIHVNGCRKIVEGAFGNVLGPSVMPWKAYGFAFGHLFGRLYLGYLPRSDCHTRMKQK